MELTISGRDKKRLKLIEELAEEMGLNINRSKNANKEDIHSNGEELYKLMKEKAASGGIKSIKDPVAWQKEQRTDKPLYGRNE